MRLMNRLLKSVKFFRMKEIPSDYVGTEKVIDEIGIFPAQVEYISAVEQGNNGLEKKSAAKLYMPSDVPIKIGDGFCIRGGVPEYMITSVIEFTDHIIVEAKLWK